MSPLARAYLEKLENELRKLPEEERLDAVREIESHIAEALRNGQSESDVLAKLGDPRKLARAYRNEHFMQMGSGRNFGDVLRMIGFYCTTGLLSVMVVPVLATIAYGFGFCAALILLAGIVRTFGVTWINMDIAPGVSVPTEWSMVYALVVGGIVGAIAYFSRKYLRKYLSFLSEQYRSALPSGKR
jgi:uncharacterized membrane protein